MATPDRRYSNLKPFLFPDQIAALRQRRLAAPAHIRIKPTNRCNHDCWYCAYRRDSLQLGDDMDLADSIPTDKMFEIIDDIIAMGVKAVTFSGGGEPTLYKRLPECVERLAMGGVRVATLTNGSNLKGRVAEAFARFGTWVRVSLDAWNDDSYALARGIKSGTFTKLMDNLKAFSASGTGCELGVSFIVGVENHAHIHEACRALKDAGVRHVKISAVVVSNDVGENNAYHDPIRMRVEEEIERTSRLCDGNFSVINHYHAMAESFAKPYHFCPSLQFLTVIGADSKVYACQDKAYTNSGFLGDIARQSFRTFWFSEENMKRIYAFDPAISCPHHCVSHGKNLVLSEFVGLDSEHAMFV